MSLPERPRLSSSVQARRHVVDAETKIVLHDVRNELVLEIDEGSWIALNEADGTRDLDALVLACARRGVLATEADLVQLLAELDAAGVLEDGLEAPPRRLPIEKPATPLDRPLDPLPGFTLVCDGSGSCCRFYGSVGFSPEEALRARVAARGMELPLTLDAAFTPLSGAQLDRGPLAVSLVDGRCLFLEESRCGLHRRAGAESKPFPCRFYPAMLMDDTVSLRVSLGPECACIFESVGREDGEPLVPREARTLADLPLGVGVMRVPDPVPLTAMRTASPRELHDWSARLASALDGSTLDAVALAWTLARTLSTEGLSARTFDAVEPPSASELAPWWDALLARSRDAAASRVGWRSASDLSRRVAEWLDRALGTVPIERALATPSDPAAERFYLRALVYGHRLSLEGRPLDHGLRDRAVRLLAARAMGQVEAPIDASAGWPLALLEAAMRNLGLAGYMDGPASLR